MKNEELLGLLLSTLVMACSDDDVQPTPDAGGADAGTQLGERDAGMDAASSFDATVAALDANVGDGSGGDASTGDASTGASSPALRVERGRYLVEHVAACVDCHTPRNADGSFKAELAMSGVDCFADAFPGDDTKGCLSSANLTNHETGLKNRSDVEIRDMLTKGVRPDGKFLHPVMPYWTLGNMRAADVDAVIAYLRTLSPGRTHGQDRAASVRRRGRGGANLARRADPAATS